MIPSLERIRFHKPPLELIELQGFMAAAADKARQLAGDYGSDTVEIYANSTRIQKAGILHFQLDQKMPDLFTRLLKTTTDLGTVSSLVTLIVSQDLRQEIANARLQALFEAKKAWAMLLFTNAALPPKYQKQHDLPPKIVSDGYYHYFPTLKVVIDHITLDKSTGFLGSPQRDNEMLSYLREQGIPLPVILNI